MMSFLFVYVEISFVGMNVMSLGSLTEQKLFITSFRTRRPSEALLFQILNRLLAGDQQATDVPHIGLHELNIRYSNNLLYRKHALPNPFVALICYSVPFSLPDSLRQIIRNHSFLHCTHHKIKSNAEQ